MNPLFLNNFGGDHLEEYVSGVFSDSLDKMGLKHQVSAGWQVNFPRARMFGRARTVVLETIETNDECIQTGLGFLGSLGQDDIMIVKGSNEYAYFGELMSRLSQERGLQGVVIDGLTRDTFYTKTINLPILARGYSPVDIKGRGRVKEVDIPIEIDGIAIAPGDYIFADNDALVVLPQNRMEELKIKVHAAITAEADIKQMISSGKSIREILVHHIEF
jgi:4-hydroxy-4-methyl-2-oxoglutarate aldolase